MEAQHAARPERTAPELRVALGIGIQQDPRGFEFVEIEFLCDLERIVDKLGVDLVFFFFAVFAERELAYSVSKTHQYSSIYPFFTVIRTGTEFGPARVVARLLVEKLLECLCVFRD